MKIDVNAIVFDQGNTLLMDPFQRIMEVKGDDFLELFKKYGVIKPLPEIISKWTESNSHVNYPYISHFTQEEPIIQHALRSLKVPAEVSESLGAELLLEYRHGLKEVINSNPRTKEVSQTLKQLKNRGKRLGTFSNDKISGLDMVLEFMDIKKYFEYIETSEKIGIEKPDIRVFSHIQDYFKLPPEQIAYIGDDPRRDIDPAKKLGWKVIFYVVDAVEYNQPWRDYNFKTEYAPDVKISKFKEILDVIV
jgi:HAD superfamily hydrolase (TIGR01549 family)